MRYEHSGSVYSRSYTSVLATELVPTFAIMRDLYDPCKFSGDIPSFNRGVCWVQESLGEFRSAVDKPVLDGEWIRSLGRHKEVLTVIDEMSGKLGRLNSTKPVAFMTGSEAWLQDIKGSTKHTVEHAIAGENIITGLDYFADEIKPNSKTASIEILHQFLTCEDLESRISGSDRQLQLSLIIQAKDILYRVLMQTYLSCFKIKISLE